MFDRWLKDGLTKSRRSQRSLAAHLGVSESVVSRMLAGLRPLKAGEIVKIAEFLGVPSPLSTAAPIAVEEVPVVAAVAADVWRKGVGGSMRSSEVRVPAVPDQKYAGLKQQAVRIDGIDSGGVGPPGAFVVFVSYFDVRKRPQHGDVVYCCRRHGDLTEHSLRRVIIAHDNVIQLETIPREPDAVTAVRFAPDSKTIEIIGLCIGLYQPL